VAVVGLAVVLTGCGGHPTERRQVAAVSVAGGAGFEPLTVTVEKDDNVVLAVGNSTATVHGFSIEGYGIQEEIQPGGMELKFKATHPGTFKIWCQLHETHKVATLVVQ
jgi:nitrosocyanin